MKILSKLLFMNRVFLLIIFIIGSKCVIGQQKIYNTTIEKANNVVVKGGKAEIRNVKEIKVGTIIIVNGVKPRYYFSEFTRTRDSSGIYTTIINLRHDGNPDNIYVDIGLEFDKPVESVDTKMGVAMSSEEKFGDNHLWYTFKGFVQSSQRVINLVVKSKTIVFVTIAGVDAKPN